MEKSYEGWLEIAQEFYRRHIGTLYDRQGPDYEAKKNEFMDRHIAAVSSTEEYRAKFDSLAEDYALYAYDPVFEPNFSHLSAYFLAQIDRLRPQRVLDSGCGIGFDLLLWTTYFPDIQFIACDISPKMIEAAERLIREQGVTNVSFFDVAHQDLTAEAVGGAVDLCTVNSCLFFSGLPSLVDHLRGFNQVLKDQSALAVSMPYGEYLEGVAIGARIAGFSDIEDRMAIALSEGKGAQFAAGTFKKIDNPDLDTLQIRVALCLRHQW